MYFLRFLMKLYKKYKINNLKNEINNLVTSGVMFEIEDSAFVKNESGDRKSIVFGANCRLSGKIICKNTGYVEVGDYSVIQDGVSVLCLEKIIIGNFVGIAGNCTICDNNIHAVGLEEWIRHRIRVAPGGPGYPGLRNGWELSESKPIVIGDAVWIGRDSVILKGVSIGEGAIVARNSVVTKDVPPFSIVAGNPAKVVKILNRPELSIQEIATSLIN